jgi:hypothetical protein
MPMRRPPQHRVHIDERDRVRTRQQRSPPGQPNQELRETACN